MSVYSLYYLDHNLSKLSPLLLLSRFNRVRLCATPRRQPTRLPRPWDSPGKNTAATKSLQLCPTLCDPIDGSPLGSSVPGILQARTLEWVTISFSNAWKWKVKVKSLSPIPLFATPWSAAYQAPPSVDFFFFDVKKQCYDEMTIFVCMSFF